MELTKKQAEGLNIALQRYNMHEPYTVISGYAGSGKSTLVSFIIEALDIDKEDVAYITYTGKASLVLKEKGCPNAMTAHKLLYKCFPNNDGTFRYIPRRPLDYDYKLIVVDEVSMLPKEMWELLLSHYIHVIALGDPGQLPPIGEDNGILSRPHIFLDEIVRQAQESEIIRLSMSIREGKPLQLMHGKEVIIIDPSELVLGMYTWADQVLCGKNETRYRTNDYIRKALWNIDDPTPILNDKVVCGHNDWNTFSKVEFQPLVNGLIGNVNSIKDITVPVPRVGNVNLFLCGLDISGTEDSYAPLLMDAKLFLEHTPTVTKENFKYLKNVPIKPFEYAYCITTHKAQGSEYNKVLVLEEFLRGGDHKRWLYTACTRAINKLVIVRNYR